MNWKVHFFRVWCAGCMLCLFSACNHSRSDQAAEEQVPDVISYNFNIRPILSDKCYKCHGPDASKREAGLRLDMPESAYNALKDNPQAHALVPGEPGLSEVYRRISTQDTTELMPPPASNLKRLSAYEVDLIKKWIKQITG